MNYERLLELSEEFGKFLESLHALYIDSVIGFRILHQRLLEYQNQIKSCLRECEEASIEFQDTCPIDYKTLCGEDFNIESESPLMKQGEVKERTAHNGTDYILMGRLCVVNAFSYWETYLRKEIAIAAGVLDLRRHTQKAQINAVLRKYVPDDFWGDMKLLRHAILHNNGKATSDFNRMKVLKWFKPDEPVNLDFDKMKFIFEQMGDFRNALGILSLPPRETRFPLPPCNP